MMSKNLCLRGIAACAALLFPRHAGAQDFVVTTISGPSSAGEIDVAALSGIAVDRLGNLYVADSRHLVIEKVTPTGIVQVIAGASGVSGSADGTGAAARFADPEGLALDQGGNLYVADRTNQAVRKVSAAGAVSTLAVIAGPGSGFLRGVAVDNLGNVFVSGGLPDVVIDIFPEPVFGNVIYKVSPAGAVSTIAGQLGVKGATDGPGTEALFNDPTGLAIDAAGDLFVADTGNDTIRMISPTGVVTTVAGMAGASEQVDGSGVQARFAQPQAIALDSFGDAFVADGPGVRRGIPSANTQGSVRFVNMSSRGTVAPSSPLIAGFVINGTVAQTVLARAIGPALAQFGVSGFLQSVQLDIYGQGGALVASSAAGTNATNSGSAGAMVGAFPLPANSGDMALVITLKPGLYSAVVTSPGGGTGVALLELYEVP